MSPYDLKAGMVVEYAGVRCEIMDKPEGWEDLFGRRMLKVLAIRKDTGRVGWLLYGPDGVVDLIDEFAAVVS